MVNNTRYRFEIKWLDTNEQYKVFTYLEEEPLEYHTALMNALLEGGFGSLDEANEIESITVTKVNIEATHPLYDVKMYIQDTINYWVNVIENDIDNHEVKVANLMYYNALTALDIVNRQIRDE